MWVDEGIELMYYLLNSVRMLQFNALIHGRNHRTELIELIHQKEIVGDLFNQLRLALQRRTKGRPAQVNPVQLSTPSFPLLLLLPVPISILFISTGNQK